LLYIRQAAEQVDILQARSVKYCRWRWKLYCYMSWWQSIERGELQNVWISLLVRILYTF
jgi:hypothetical protein